MSSDKGQAYGVQVTFKYGQTMINLPADTDEELRGKLEALTGEKLDGKPTIDFVMDITETLHKGERESGIFVEPKFSRGGGGGAPSGGSGGGGGAPRPTVDPARVTYWADRNRQVTKADLPFPEGTQGPACDACGGETRMQWSPPSKTAGPNYGKSWPLWNCVNGRGRGHGSFYKG